MRYQRQVIDGEVTITRVPDEQATPADSRAGIEAENPRGSFELLMRMFPPPPEEEVTPGGNGSVA